MRTIMCLLLLSSPVWACSPSGLSIDRVIDGDTIVVEDTILRLARINAPENKTPAGKAVTRYVKSYLQGKSISYRIDDTGKYGRAIAEVWVDGVNLSDHLLRHKLANYYKPYLKYR